jgi:cytochrome b pre-mRNA-processing protein 3
MIFRRESAARAEARRLYGQVVAQARQPGFYAGGGVPDSLDGRFEMVVLHMVLVMRRLKELGEPGAQLARRLSEAMVADMDANLREMGAGDLGVGRRVKRMAQALYGRAAAYEAALAGAPGGLDEALRRNLFGTVEAAPETVMRMADYVRASAAALALQPAAAVLAGRVDFPGPPR